MADNTELPDTGFVREPAVLRVFPVSRSTWWEGVRTGRYPAPVKLSARISAWRVEDIRRLIDELGDADASGAVSRSRGAPQ